MGKDLQMNKCIIYGCTNKKHEGKFVGDICKPCYEMITKGKADQPSTNFIASLYKENIKLKIDKAKETINDVCDMIESGEFLYEHFNPEIDKLLKCIDKE